MTREDVKEMCRRMDIYFDEEHPDHISDQKIKGLKTPFMEYILTDHPIHADGCNYINILDMTVRIYSDNEASEAEKKVQEVLEEEEIRWTRSCEYIEEIGLFAIIYKMEV